MPASCLPWLQKKERITKLLGDGPSVADAASPALVAGALTKLDAATNGNYAILAGNKEPPTSHANERACAAGQCSANAVRDSLIMSTTSEIITIVTLSGEECIYQNPASIAWLGHLTGADHFTQLSTGSQAEPKPPASYLFAESTMHAAPGLATLRCGVLLEIFACEPEKLELMMEELTGEGHCSDWKGLVRMGARTTRRTTAAMSIEPHGPVATAGTAAIRPLQTAVAAAAEATAAAAAPALAPAPISPPLATAVTAVRAPDAAVTPAAAAPVAAPRCLDWVGSPSAVTFRSFCSIGTGGDADVDSGGLLSDGSDEDGDEDAVVGMAGPGPVAGGGSGGGVAAAATPKGPAPPKARYQRRSVPAVINHTSSPVDMAGNAAPASSVSRLLASTPGMILSLSERLQLEAQSTLSYGERGICGAGCGGCKGLDVFAGDIAAAADGLLGEGDDASPEIAAFADLPAGPEAEPRREAGRLVAGSPCARASAGGLWSNGGGGGGSDGVNGGGGGGGRVDGTEPRVLAAFLPPRNALSPCHRHSLDSMPNGLAALSPIPSSSMLPHLPGIQYGEKYDVNGFPPALGLASGTPIREATRVVAAAGARVAARAGEAAALPSPDGNDAAVGAVLSLRTLCMQVGYESSDNDDAAPVDDGGVVLPPLSEGGSGGGGAAAAGGLRAKLSAARSAGNLHSGASGSGLAPRTGSGRLRNGIRSLLSRVLHRSLTIDAIDANGYGGSSGRGSSCGRLASAADAAATATGNAAAAAAAAAATAAEPFATQLNDSGMIPPGLPGRRLGLTDAVHGIRPGCGYGFPSQRRGASLDTVRPVSNHHECFAWGAADVGATATAVATAPSPLPWTSAPSGLMAARVRMPGSAPRPMPYKAATLPPPPPRPLPSPSPSAAFKGDLPVRAPPGIPSRRVLGGLAAIASAALPSSADSGPTGCERPASFPHALLGNTVANATVRQHHDAARSCRRILSLPPDGRTWTSTEGSGLVARTTSYSAGASRAGMLASSMSLSVEMPLHAVTFAGSLRTAPPAALFLAAGTSSLKRAPSARVLSSAAACSEVSSSSSAAAATACGGGGAGTGAAPALASPCASEIAFPPSFPSPRDGGGGGGGEGASFKEQSWRRHTTQGLVAAEGSDGVAFDHMSAAVAVAAAATMGLARPPPPRPSQHDVFSSAASSSPAAAATGAAPTAWTDALCGDRPTNDDGSWCSRAAATAAALLAPANGASFTAASATVATAAAAVAEGVCSPAGPERWHEVWARRVLDPILGQDVIIIAQHDVTARVVSERHLALVMETEHRLLEQLYPRHILEGIVEDWTEHCAAAESASATGLASAAAISATADIAAVTATSGSVSRSWRPVVRDPYALATWHPQVTLLFADICGFTPLCKEMEPRAVMHLLNALFSRFDSQLDKCGVFKVETIGDCYFVAGGLVDTDEDGMTTVRSRNSRDLSAHALRVFRFAQAMLAAAKEVTIPITGKPVQIRVGIHTGPVVSGVVGTRMPRFCLFGDTVNTASRMESTGVPGAVHVSEATYRYLSDLPGWQPTGGIEVKGKGHMKTFLHRPPA